MKNIAFFLLLTLLNSGLLFAQTSKDQQFDLAIRNVDIFDSKTKAILKDKTILISGDRIHSIVDSSSKVTARKTIKGKGKLVTPGFVDTHTHILQTYGSRNFDRKYKLEDDVLESYKKLIARQFLASGITTIVDMGQPEPWVETTIKLQKNPTPDYPNVFINGSSTISNPGRNGFLPLHHEPVASAADGRKKVQKYSKLGIQHMKLYSRLRAEDMKPIVDEARKFGITLNAHVDNNLVTIPKAMELGVRNFEHFFTVTPSILEFDKHYPKLDIKYGLRRGMNIDEFAAKMVFYFGYIKDNPELDGKLRQLFEKMAANNSNISTALNVLATAAGRSHTFSTFEFLPPRNTPMTRYSKTQRQSLSDAFDAMMKYMKAAHDKGVEIRIGSDTRYGSKAFFSELLLFSEAGFPVEDVLQIATYNGAKAMKISDKYGSIEEGKKADLIIFEKSPFDDYRNFRMNKIVVKGGKVFELKKSLAYSLMERIEKHGIKSTPKWFLKHKKTGRYGPLDEAEMNEVGFQLLSRGKVKEALEVDRLKRKAFPVSSKVYNGLSESAINGLAYNYLQNNQIKTALQLFSYNVKNYPKSSNAFDSLGEAHLANNNKILALSNYKKSVELNPKNFNAVNVINKLEDRKLTISDNILKSYIGKYQMSENRIFIVSKKGENLFWERIGQTYKVAMEPVSQTRFVFPGTNESVVFEKDAQGVTNGLTLDQSGRLTRLKKLK